MHYRVARHWRLRRRPGSSTFTASNDSGCAACTTRLWMTVTTVEGRREGLSACEPGLTSTSPGSGLRFRTNDRADPHPRRRHASAICRPEPVAPVRLTERLFIDAMPVRRPPAADPVDEPLSQRLTSPPRRICGEHPPMQFPTSRVQSQAAVAGKTPRSRTRLRHER
jgi:hypothetical protein